MKEILECTLIQSDRKGSPMRSNLSRLQRGPTQGWPQGSTLLYNGSACQGRGEGLPQSWGGAGNPSL